MECGEFGVCNCATTYTVLCFLNQRELNYKRIEGSGIIIIFITLNILLMKIIYYQKMFTWSILIAWNVFSTAPAGIPS